MDVAVWWERALKDFETAKKNRDIDELGAAAFYFQQSVEKGLKYVLLREDEGLVKSHDCFALAKRAGLPDGLVDKADRLSAFYFRTRYPDDELVELDDHDMDRIESAAEEVLEWIDGQY